ncbi:hypothetical protein PF004_g3128 [Phytophthora fragariae]|uniref:Uncharacterized protein n=1 Tax=Phytophthora fragariae TaxID=53985 RepID=A0A6G0PMG1_9STRA|nr:hypothetical protein PF004_g3128 [Phytophthora fragariae]KAE9354493.1 hypothetical protein PF008_g4505 [Phytophthora fragariae]
MRVLRPTLVALQRLRAHSARQQRVQLLVRAFSDAADPAKHSLGSCAASPSSSTVSNASAPHTNGFINGSSNGHADLKLQTESVQFLASYQDDQQLEEEQHEQDIDFTAQRIGFPISEAELKERAEYETLHDLHEVDGIREETRAEAEAKAERIMAVLRHSMSELEIGKVIHRIAQYATLPRVTGLSRKQFLRSLETRFGENNKKELGYMLAFLQGRDEVIEQLEVDSRLGGAESESVDDSLTQQTEQDAQVDETGDEFVVPKIMGLHPDLVADPQFVSIVFCYCRLACLNSLKLMQRPAAGLNRGSKSSLWQVKADFKKVLDMEGLAHYADMLGLEKPAKYGEEDMDAVDAEWEEFNLENDRIDFRMLLSQTQGIVNFMKDELSNETISKMLVAMLASVKTSKLHRKIFQEMVCNVQTAFPETYHEQLLSELVPFLSGDNATYEDFDSDTAATALQHHQMRNEAIIRALLETRMRVGHILINDIDDAELSQSISKRLTPEQHEKVITTAWNIVSVLDDRKYHMFFTRFLKYKLAWRPNRTTFGETFLSDVRKTLGPRDAETIMPMFEEVFQQLSVETLTICRVKLRHSRKLLRGRGALEPLNDAGRERLETAWQPSRCAFFSNLPHGVTQKHLEQALSHIGGVKRFLLFANPLNGPPDLLSDENDEEEGDNVVEDDVEDVENEDGTVKDKPKKKKKKKKKTKSKMEKAKAKDMTMFRKLRKKDTIIASDKKTPYQAVVEFDSESACRKANMRALQIFGVMMVGYKEYRPVFPTSVDNRSGITLMNVPYGTMVGELVDEVNDVLSKAGLSMKVSGLVPRGVMLTNGRLDLRFPSFVEAAQVAELLNDHVYPMKCRRPPSRRDEERIADYMKFQNTLKSEAGKDPEEKPIKKEKKEAKVIIPQDEDEPISYAAPDGDEDEDDGADDAGYVDNGILKKSKLDVSVVKESLEEYFEAWREPLENLIEEQKALGDKPRPFDVTWAPLPKPRNKHMYL